MKNLLAILIVLIVAQTGFGQTKDTTKVYWGNGTLKYIEYNSPQKYTDSDGVENLIILIVSEYYNESNVKISEKEFISKYGTELIDSINAHKQKEIEAKELKLKKDNPTSYSYSELIKSADNLFFNKEYQKALEYYKKASEIKPDEKYPSNKIDELKALIKLQNK
ncbi:MAG: hypothetical protein H6586_01540 [Flavobacteriales bacterium]|nr:hypothetical protein [Flavobacteriales bacterium]